MRYRYRRKYWSEFVRNNEKLIDIADNIQNVVMFPIDVYHDVVYYIKNRFFVQSHALVATRDHIPRGTWADLDQRILYCLFDSLVDFVEIEKAWIEVAFSAEARTKYNTPKYRGVTRWRCAQAGVDHLKWKIEDHNCETSKKILDLYNWWKYVRPARQDPYDISGTKKFSEEMREKYGSILLMGRSYTDEEIENQTNVFQKWREIEGQYEQEDTDKLIELIKIRGSLWT